jgi:hypothetical protein
MKNPPHVAATRAELRSARAMFLNRQFIFLQVQQWSAKERNIIMTTESRTEAKMAPLNLPVPRARDSS